MAGSRALLAPVLPQMGSDGIITAKELESGTVDVLVPRYSNIEVGDAIRVFFGNTLSAYRTVKESDIQHPTMLFSFSEKLIPDNVYNVYYTAMDWVGNIGTSPNILAVVSRDGNKILIPPIFADAENNVITVESVVANSGTHILVPPYQGIRSGDTVTLSSSVFTAEGDPITEGTYAVTHVVSETEQAMGFTVLVPPSKVLLPQSRTIKASYSVVRATSAETDSSSVAEAGVEASAEFLTAPWFPDAVMGWLLSEQVTGGVRVHVPVHTFAQVNDTVTLFWKGYDVDSVLLENASGQTPHSLTANDIATGLVEFTVPYSTAVLIRFGRIEAYYTVLQQGKTYFSYNGFANIDLIHTALPAPVFTQSQGGKVDASDIQKDGGIALSVSYPDMLADDLVTVVISGTDSDSNSVPTADYQQSYPITTAQSQNKKLDIILPASLAAAVGENGKLVARYYVLHANENGFSFSHEAFVMVINTTAINDGMSFFATTGAPVFDYDSVHVRPYNMGFVKAPPGSSITAYCSAPATFMETESTEYKFTVGISGTASFHIKSPQNGLINLALVDNDNQMPQLNTITTFSAYQAGNGKLKAYAFTTGARADGASPCSLYVMAEKESDSELDGNNADSAENQDDDAAFRPITMMRISVTGSATLQGYGTQSAELFLNSDNSAEIGILNTVAETVNVTLSLPESTGSVQTLAVNFKNFQ